MFNYLHIHRTENVGKAAFVKEVGLSPSEGKRQYFFCPSVCVCVCTFLKLLANYLMNYLMDCKETHKVIIGCTSKMYNQLESN